ncbi:cytoplasmic dynein 2 light intermediate chain 1-like isoform X1 [Lytechinus variegatus]|uniref:cytoplasmic dynein 2 light intermediate chain 1-like isoform X1 n=1 Tax=Lytechinus variegatus TaxID=7654 RepID=UPI001BB0FF95|nr:cytoplasmic dynein 2 light intermediate chain 1-like isoform X1 [Lytechinus variegatus]
MPKSVEKSIWDIAVLEAEKKNASESKDEGGETKGSENHILFIGSKNAGKTSIILRFLEKEEAPKPTIALEYTFGRRAKGHNMSIQNRVKDICHIWELGGGTFLSQLTEIPLTEDTIMSSSVMVVMDLSQPYELWHTMETLIKSALDRVEQVISKAARNDPSIQDRIKERAWKRIGVDHPDRDMLDPFPLPLVIIGTKYDVYQDFDPEKRKVISKTLRFIAHNYGAALQFSSNKTDGLMSRTKNLVSHLAFSTTLSLKTISVDPNKPISVPFGLDSLEQIGLPPVGDDDLGRSNARTPLDLWKQAFTSYFPQKSTIKAIVEDPSKDPQYAEAAVDNMREQKNKELERYRKQAERRAKENKTGGSGDGILRL